VAVNREALKAHISSKSKAGALETPFPGHSAWWNVLKPWIQQLNVGMTRIHI